MKKTYYFSHDFNARNDIKMQEVLMKMGLEGHGLFWNLVEMLYEQGGKLELTKCDSIAFALRTDSEKIKTLINIIFEQDDKYFWSNSVLKRIKMQSEKSKKAKTSANKRWKNEAKNGNANSNANAMPTHSEGNAIKERKRKEIKRNKIEREIPPSPLKNSIKYLEEIPPEDITEFTGKYIITEKEIKAEAASLIGYCQMHGKKYKDYRAFLRNAIAKDFREKPEIPKEKPLSDMISAYDTS